MLLLQAESRVEAALPQEPAVGELADWWESEESDTEREDERLVAGQRTADEPAVREEEQQEVDRRRGRRRRRPLVGVRLAGRSTHLLPVGISLILYLVISSIGPSTNPSSKRHNGPASMNYFQVQAFNIDTQSAVVHSGPEGSYFGYSVAQHRDRGVNYLLVGAPKVQTSQPGVKSSGAVYRCAPSNVNACQQIPFDPTGSSQIDLRGEKHQTDDKSRQWFGASLQSATENGSIVACAPAYVHFSTNFKRRDPVGTCWVSRGSFSGFLEYSPCRLNDQWGHHHLGSCQAGFASAITKDGSRLFMAAPGAHVWQGQVFMHNLRSDLTNSTSGVNPHSEDDSYLGYSLALGRFSGHSAGSSSSASADSDLAIGIPRANELAGKVMIVDREMRTLRNITGEQVGAYFGYALATADVNGDGLDDLLIGAPNYYNLTAAHKESNFDRGRVYVALQTQRHEFNLAQQLDGAKNRARFGTALANAGDLNRDGLQDLAVGAPGDEPEGHGAVYIFMGRRGSSSTGGVSQQPDQVIYASSVDPALRSFGFALSGGLDIDMNQYPDLLVGDYKSDRAVLLRARPVVTAATSITFQPENFNLEDKSCLLPNSTISVSCITVQYCTKYSGLGVDNKLPFVYDIKLDTENKGAPRLFFLNQEGKSEDQNQSTLTKDVQQCRSFKAYIMRQIRDKLTPFKIDIDYNLAELPELPAGSNKLRPVLAKANQPSANKMSKVAMIQRNCGPDNVCLPDLKLNMEANLDSYTIGSKDKIILNVTVKNQGEDAFESMFFLTMPMDIDFIKTESSRSDSPVCYGPKPDQTGENVLVCDLGNPQARNEVVKFSVITEPARSGQLSQADFTFAGLVNSTNPELDERHREDNQVQIGIPIRVDFSLQLSGNSQPSRWVHNATHQQLQQQRQLAAQQQQQAIQQNQQIQVASGSELVVTKPRMSEADVGPEIYHNYQLQNKGPSTINDIALTILWPTKTQDGNDYLLYLVDEPQTNNKVKCKPAPDDAINPLGLRYLSGSTSPGISGLGGGQTKASTPAPRNRRQVGSGETATAVTTAATAPEAMAQMQTTTVDESILQQLYLPSCGPSQCTRFECNVNNLANGEIASIKIRSRLFEETISKLSLQEFIISSKLIAQLKSLPYNVSTQSMPPYSYKVETQVLTTGIAVQDLLPWWLIVLAVLLGILLFALLACFLKYLGFFARKRPPKANERDPQAQPIWNDYQYSPGDTAL